MKTPETIEEITQRASAFAESAGAAMHSGHLLLAVLTGSGVAANTGRLVNGRSVINTNCYHNCVCYITSAFLPNFSRNPCDDVPEMI